MTAFDHSRAARRAVVPLLAAAALVLSACGSSSSGSSTSASASNTAAGRRAEIAGCLKKQGITPPARRGGTGGGAPPAGGGLFGGGQSRSPQSTKFRDALRKCGITFGGRGRGGIFTTAAGRLALDRFVACVRRNGFTLPAPNTSGNGPVFDPAKVNRNDPKLQAAAARCQSLLPRRPAGNGGPGVA